jgi:uncharacterized repeat protein (TIGR01451 family)
MGGEQMKEINWKGILYAKRYMIIGLLICVVALSGCIEQPDLRVQKTVNASFAALGNNVTYKYNITNYNSTFPAEDITLVDDRLGHIELPQENLGPGQSMIVTLEHEVNETDLNTLYEGAFIVNNVSVNGTINGQKIPHSPYNATAVVATPITVIKKTASTNVAKLGDEIEYEITIYNPTDTLNATNVTVNDTFDGPVDFVFADPTPSVWNNTSFTWVINRTGPKESSTIDLVIKPQEQETPFALKNCAAITKIENDTVEKILDDLSPIIPDSYKYLPYFHACDSVTVVSREYSSLNSFEQLLRDQHKLLASFDDLTGQTPVTREQKIESLYSIEDLYRRQAVGMDKFSIWINENWENLTPVEKAQITASLEDLLRRQAKNLDAFNGNLLAWVKTFDPVYRQKFSDSFEDLLHRQVALLKNFERVLNQDGMQTPLFLASFEDLLRRQAQSLEGFGDLGEFTFNDTMPQEEAGIAIYKTANRTSLECGEPINYKYTVYNNGNQNVTDIVVTDLNLPGGPIVGTIPMLEVYQSESINRTVTYDCSHDVVYPIKVCNNATAKGTASSGEAVSAESNEVCVILNGPQQPTLDFILEKTAKPGIASPGETIVYTYTIINNGMLPITGINIEDDKLGEVTTDQELQPGESKQYTMSTTMGDGDITNNATATGMVSSEGAMSQVPKAQMVTATATATVKLCTPKKFTGFLIQPPASGCEYALETLDGQKYQLLPEEGYEEEFLENISGCCLLNVSGCLLDTPTTCGQLMIVDNIECADIKCQEGTALVELTGRISEDGGCYYLDVSPTTPSPPGRRFELSNEDTPESVWNQITNNVGMTAIIVGCEYTGWKCGENANQDSPGIIVKCVKISNEISCPPKASPDVETGIVVRDVNGCYYLQVGNLNIGLEQDPQTNNWDKLEESVGKTVTISGCRYPDGHVWSCTASEVPDYVVLVRIVLPQNDQYAPIVKMLSSSSGFEIPDGLKVVCLQGPDTLDPSDVYPVLSWGGYTYWALSHIDNRYAMTIVAYDSSGKIVKQWYEEGARYLWKIDVDDQAKTVTFWGQANNKIVMTWDELKL